jgi:hypothetical protein
VASTHLKELKIPIPLPNSSNTRLKQKKTIIASKRRAKIPRMPVPDPAFLYTLNTPYCLCSEKDEGERGNL